MPTPESSSLSHWWCLGFWQDTDTPHEGEDVWKVQEWPQTPARVCSQHAEESGTSLTSLKRRSRKRPAPIYRKTRCGPRTFLTCRTDVKLNMTIKSDSLHPNLTVFTSTVLLLIHHINHWTRIGWKGSCCVFTVAQRISEELRTTDTSMARIFILTFVFCETCLMCSSNVRPCKSDRFVYSTYCTCF